MEALNDWLRVPYKVIDHFAAIRPANTQRRPFIGMHPVYKNIGIFNGMGTKGCSLAPFFAEQFTSHILQQTTLDSYQKMIIYLLKQEYVLIKGES